MDFDGQFVSTSTDPSVAYEFTYARTERAVVFEIEATGGLPVESVTKMPGEEEILFGRDKRFRVIRTEAVRLTDYTRTDRDVTIIVLQEVT